MKQKELLQYLLRSWAPILKQFQKDSLMLEEASPLNVWATNSHKSEEVIMDEPQQVNLHVWFWLGFPEVWNNLASACRYRSLKSGNQFTTNQNSKNLCHPCLGWPTSFFGCNPFDPTKHWGCNSYSKGYAAIRAEPMFPSQNTSFNLNPWLIKW